MNEDKIAPHTGFQTHSHDNMEILTFVLSGRLTHEDSLGNKEYINEGEFQLMRAGTGISHSEKNDDDKEVHLYQIWIEPKEQGLKPKYDQKNFQSIINSWQVIADSQGKEGFQVNQDITMKYGIFDDMKEMEIKSGWLQIIEGSLEIDGKILTTSDGIELDKTVKINPKSKLKLLSFEY